MPERSSFEQEQQLLFEMSLNVRILREHQKHTTASIQLLDERELILLELISGYEQAKSITPRVVGRIFGLQHSSVTNLLTNMTEKKGYLERTGGSDKPLKLTEEGKKALTDYKRISSARFEFLLSEIKSDAEVKALRIVLPKLLAAAVNQVREQIFGMPI